VPCAVGKQLQITGLHADFPRDPSGHHRLASRGGMSQHWSPSNLQVLNGRDLEQKNVNGVEVGEPARGRARKVAIQCDASRLDIHAT
jgi:hypothetical protein